MHPSKYLLPADDISLRVGRIVLAAARLEFEARNFANELGVKSSGLSLSDLRKALIRETRGFSEKQRIATWVADAFALWGERGTIAHGAWLDVYDDVDPSLHALVSQRGWKELRTDIEHLDDLFERTIAATMEGIEIANSARDRRIAASPAWGGPFGMP